MNKLTAAALIAILTLTACKDDMQAQLEQQQKQIADWLFSTQNDARLRPCNSNLTNRQTIRYTNWHRMQ